MDKVEPPAPTIVASAVPARPVVAPFQFCTSLVLEEATGLRASTLPQLLSLLREVPESCIYHHTHYFLLAHQYLTLAPTNDFAYWVMEVLGEEALGERLAAIDIMSFNSLRQLREALVAMIEEYLQQAAVAKLRFVGEGEEFFFTKSMLLIMPTPHQASTLAEFAQALERVSLHTLYFHMFDARLRLGRPTNDFARWLGEQLGLRELAQQVERLDPYSQTLEELRGSLLALIRTEMTRGGASHA